MRGKTKRIRENIILHRHPNHRSGTYPERAILHDQTRFGTRANRQRNTPRLWTAIQWGADGEPTGCDFRYYPVFGDGPQWDERATRNPAAVHTGRFDALRDPPLGRASNHRLP